MKPRKPKGPSLKQVARTYRKTTKPATNYNEGSRYFNEGAKSTHLGAKTRKNTYKPSPKSATFGGTRNGKGATIKKRGVA